MVGKIGEVESVDEERIQVSVNKSVKNTHDVSDYSSYGLDSRPVKGMKVFLMNLRERAHKIFLGVKKTPAQTKAKPGETRLYSKTGSQVYLDENDNIIIETSGGAILTMTSSGIIEANGNAKSAMTFEEFVSVWNSYIGKYENHSHFVASVGAESAIVTQILVAGDKDMTPAQSAKLKIGQN